MTSARAASIALIAGCGSSGAASFAGDAWLANEVMTASCEGTTTTTAYPVTLSFVVNPAGIEYRDPVVHCWIELGVEGDEATLVGQPAGCNTIIDAQVVPIDVTQATITSTGSSLNLMMAGTTSSCAITIAAGAAR